MRSAAIERVELSPDGHAATGVAEIIDRMSDLIYRRLGERIRRTRERVGFTQAQLGAKINLSPARISRYENGSGYIAPDLLFRMARAMNVPFRSLLDIEEESIPSPSEQPIAPTVHRQLTKTSEEEELLRAYRRLSPHMRATVRLFANEAIRVDSRSQFYDPAGKASDNDDGTGNG